jgi:hypothetical protein
MCYLMARSGEKSNRVSDGTAAIEKSLPAIAEGQPEGSRNASCRAGDGTTLVALLELEYEEERDLFRRRAAAS